MDTLYRIWIRFPLKSHVISENNGNITDNGKQNIRQSFQRRAKYISHEDSIIMCRRLIKTMSNLIAEY